MSFLSFSKSLATVSARGGVRTSLWSYPQAFVDFAGGQANFDGCIKPILELLDTDVLAAAADDDVATLQDLSDCLSVTKASVSFTRLLACFGDDSEPIGALCKPGTFAPIPSQRLFLQTAYFVENAFEMLSWSVSVGAALHKSALVLAISRTKHVCRLFGRTFVQYASGYSWKRVFQNVAVVRIEKVGSGTPLFECKYPSPILRYILLAIICCDAWPTIYVHHLASFGRDRPVSIAFQINRLALGFALTTSCERCHVPVRACFRYSRSPLSDARTDFVCRQEA